MHCPDNSATQANLEAVRDHVHLVFTPWLLSTPDPVKEFLAPGSAVVRRSLAKYFLAIDRDLLQRANQDKSFTRACSVRVETGNQLAVDTSCRQNEEQKY